MFLTHMMSICRRVHQSRTAIRVKNHIEIGLAYLNRLLSAMKLVMLADFLQATTVYRAGSLLEQ